LISGRASGAGSKRRRVAIDRKVARRDLDAMTMKLITAAAIT
jgi:hypothetical protein